MTKTTEKGFLFLCDFIAINATFLIWEAMQQRFDFHVEFGFINHYLLSLMIFIFWFCVFCFFGLYQACFICSRTDEFITVTKVVSAGIFLVFLITFDFERDLAHPFSLSRLMVFLYWGMMIFFVGIFRVLFRTVYRKFLEMGIGQRRTLIVGWGRKARDLYDQVLEAPALGYKIVGFVTPERNPPVGNYKKIPIQGPLKHLDQIIHREAIQEILIALPRRSERYLQEVISQCNGRAVGMKIVPDLYDVIIGQVRTNQIYGFPLIEILPELMPPWERLVKRLCDVLFSLVILIGFLPIWLIVALVIRMDSQGPIFYAQKRVGRNGKVYKMIKFRSMVVGAEKMTGPIWATNNDPRVTRVGRFLRRLRLDEIPQLINVLSGDMSLVGPRPERLYFVKKFRKVFPLYSRRLHVRPGITGWAQIKGGYDQSLEHVKKKLEYDLFYLENMSLRMDLKIVLSTIYVMLLGKGH